MNKNETNKDAIESFIDWAIEQKQKLTEKGKWREMKMLDVQVSLAKKSGLITETDQRRFNETKGQVNS